MDDRALEELLRRFGLSSKEVDTYLTLLELGEAKASDVATAAGVSKRYVYSVSEELEGRGFVAVNDHTTPTTIRARPPGEVVRELSGDLESMQPALEARYSRPTPSEDLFEVVKSRVTVVKRMARLIGDADGEVTLAAPSTAIDEVADPLRRAVDRDVMVTLLVSGEASIVTDREYDGLASVVRTWTVPMPSMLTVDQRAGLLAPAEMLRRSNSGERAITFAQAQIAPVFVGSFLGNYWPMAGEAYVADPVELPASFAGFRHAVLQATLHRRAGATIRADIEATPVHEEGDPVELVGRVVGSRQGLVEPVSNTFPVENALIVETDEGTYSVGGAGAFIEDLEASRVELSVTDA